MIEEFLPGEGATESINGEVTSKLVGSVKFDGKQKLVTVKPFKHVEKIGVGDMVLVKVREVQDKLTIVEILAKDGKPLKYKRVAAILHDHPIKDFQSAPLGVNDIVLASVYNVLAGNITLKINCNECGTVMSVCDKCGGILKLINNVLKCNVCGNKEKRKISKFYGDLSFLSNWLKVI